MKSFDQSLQGSQFENLKLMLLKMGIKKSQNYYSNWISVGSTGRLLQILKFRTSTKSQPNLNRFENSGSRTNALTIEVHKDYQ